MKKLSSVFGICLMLMSVHQKGNAQSEAVGVLQTISSECDGTVRAIDGTEIPYFDGGIETKGLQVGDTVNFDVALMQGTLVASDLEEVVIDTNQQNEDAALFEVYVPSFHKTLYCNDMEVNLDDGNDNSYTVSLSNVVSVKDNYESVERPEGGPTKTFIRGIAEFIVETGTNTYAIKCNPADSSCVSNQRSSPPQKMKFKGEIILPDVSQQISADVIHVTKQIDGGYRATVEGNVVTEALDTNSVNKEKTATYLGFRTILYNQGQIIEIQCGPTHDICFVVHYHTYY